MTYEQLHYWLKGYLTDKESLNKDGIMVILNKLGEIEKMKSVRENIEDDSFTKEVQKRWVEGIKRKDGEVFTIHNDCYCEACNPADHFPLKEVPSAYNREYWEGKD